MRERAIRRLRRGSIRAAPGMHVEWIDQEAVVLNPATRELHYLNPPAALTYALILEHGFDEAMTELERRRPATAQADKELRDLLTELREKGLLLDG